MNTRHNQQQLHTPQPPPFPLFRTRRGRLNVKTTRSLNKIRNRSSVPKRQQLELKKKKAEKALDPLLLLDVMENPDQISPTPSDIGYSKIAKRNAFQKLLATAEV